MVNKTKQGNHNWRQDDVKMRGNVSIGSHWRVTWVTWQIGIYMQRCFLSFITSGGIAAESEAGRPIKTGLWAGSEGNKCWGNCSNKAWVFNGWANHLSLMGMLAFAAASDFVSFSLSQIPPVSTRRRTRCWWTWGKLLTWYAWRTPTPLHQTCLHGPFWWALQCAQRLFPECLSAILSIPTVYHRPFMLHRCTIFHWL